MMTMGTRLCLSLKHRSLPPEPVRIQVPAVVKARVKRTFLVQAPRLKSERLHRLLAFFPQRYLTSTCIGMLCLERASLIFNLLKVSVSLRPFLSSLPSTVSTTTVLLPCRALSTMFLQLHVGCWVQVLYILLYRIHL